ncbi:S8 family serine peptidase [Vibrio sp. Of7-15]|uniref:S8 family serine peptidase n=1 Tax=Vibrio sp. Of7-15 TaxID=2724879 RepID=UPI001EF2B5A9|nr:S8 family serine peptidase [Vibrio sp. Of7-15]MCG7497130.1 S8 family serine peptidase [Vibrio sp. Of7-15]
MSLSRLLLVLTALLVIPLSAFSNTHLIVGLLPSSSLKTTSPEEKLFWQINDQYEVSYRVLSQHQPKIVLVTVGDNEPWQTIYLALKNHSEVNYVEFDQPISSLPLVKRQATFQANETSYALEQLKIDVLSESERQCDRIRIGVLDSGIDFDHEDLQSVLEKSMGSVVGVNTINSSVSATDDYGHGTHVAGIIGSQDVVHPGACKSARLVPLKFLNQAGGGSVSDAVEAIAWAVDNNIPLMNHSWTVNSYNQALADIMTSSTAQGMLHITAAGNSGANNDRNNVYPAKLSQTISGVIAVANNTDERLLYRSSNYGLSSVDVAAPGSDILNLNLNNGSSHRTGTSMSAPFVTAIAAMLWQQDESLTPGQIRAVLSSTVTQSDVLKAKIRSGGIVNAQAALQAYQQKPVALYGLTWQQNKLHLLGQELASVTAVNIDYDATHLENQSLAFEYDSSSQQIKLTEPPVASGMITVATADQQAQLYYYAPVEPADNLSLIANGDEFILSWRLPASVNETYVYRALPSEGFKFLGRVEAPISQFTDNPNQEGEVRYRVKTSYVSQAPYQNILQEQMSEYSAAISHSWQNNPWQLLQWADIPVNVPVKLPLRVSSELQVTLSDGSLPSGLTIENGYLAGQATQAGNYTFTLQATDNTNSWSRSFDLEVMSSTSWQTPSQQSQTFIEATSGGISAISQFTQEGTVITQIDVDSSDSPLALINITVKDTTNVALQNIELISNGSATGTESSVSVQPHQAILSVTDQSAYDLNSEPNAITIQYTQAISSVASASSESDSRCFIATALFPNSPMLLGALRSIRDDVILPFPYGSHFIEMYYLYSPLWVDLLKDMPVITFPLTGILGMWALIWHFKVLLFTLMIGLGVKCWWCKYNAKETVI